MKEIQGPISNPFASFLNVPKIDDAGQAAAARRHVLWRKSVTRPHRSRLPTYVQCYITIMTYITASAIGAFV